MDLPEHPGSQDEPAPAYHLDDLGVGIAGRKTGSTGFRCDNRAAARHARGHVDLRPGSAIGSARAGRREGPTGDGGAHERVRYPAVRRRDNLVRAVPAQGDLALLRQRVTHPGAPPQAVGQRAGRRIQRLDLHRPVEPGQSAQLLTDHPGFEATLRGNGGVLPVASAATAGPGMRARRGHPVRRRPQDLDGVSPPVPVVRGVGQAGPDPFTRQRVPDEDNPALVAGHAHPAMRDRPDVKLDNPHGFAGGPLGNARLGTVTAHRRVASASVPSAGAAADG